MAEIRVHDVPERQRYEAVLGDSLLGVVTYERREGVIVLNNTRVAPVAKGRGIEVALARTALNAARIEGLRVVPQCHFMASWVERHPGYADLVEQPPGR